MRVARNVQGAARLGFDAVDGVTNIVEGMYRNISAFPLPFGRAPEGGARGIIYASQISIDDENGLTIRVYGDKGGLYWRQEEPNSLIVKWPDQPRQILTPGVNYPDRLCEAAHRCCRVPAGHPEGFFEAFANLYGNFANAVRARQEGQQPDPLDMDFPTIEDGVRGMAFVKACVDSSKQGAVWVKPEA